ncbi:putative transcriptional regulator [Streptomyces lydicamycinicus]|uniref:Putative transcriptional regulator n=1 Tax=Streptomyces lydicamycinicus TaxID=1546107 RepID=A0A0P4R4B3_9ACTN|nr:putative transcriptional regulator [Streptomyces lydicamycinicus]
MQHAFVEEFARQYGRDAGRVGRDHLGGHATHGLLHRNVFHGPEEGIARQAGLLEPQGRRGRDVDRGTGGQVRPGGGHRPQRLQEHGCRLLIVSVGELGVDAAVVGQMHIDMPVLAKPVGHPVPRGVEAGDVHDDRKRIEVVCQTRTAEVRTVVNVEAVDLLDGPAHLSRQLEGPLQQVMAVLGHLPAPAVEAGVDQHGRAGGTEQIGPGLEQGRVDQVAL